MTDKEISKSKLGVLLKALSKKEYNSFITYLGSPLFNKKKEFNEAPKFLFKFQMSAIRTERMNISWKSN